MVLSGSALDERYKRFTKKVTEHFGKSRPKEKRPGGGDLYTAVPNRHDATAQRERGRGLGGAACFATNCHKYTVQPRQCPHPSTMRPHSRAAFAAIVFLLQATAAAGAEGEGFSTPFAPEFFKEKCLRQQQSSQGNNGGDDDKDDPLSIVDEYLGRWVTGLSIPSVSLSGLQLLVVFVLLQTGGVPNPRSKDGSSITCLGLSTYVCWMSFLAGGIVSTFSSLLTTVLSYGSLEHQHRDCMVEMRSGDAFLNLTLPPLLILHPFIVAKAGVLSANIFVFQQGLGVGFSLSSDAVKRMFNAAMLALWGLPVAAAVAWFFMTLCFFWSSMFLFPIALFQILELACAWWGVVKLKRWLERRAAAKTKQAQQQQQQPQVEESRGQRLHRGFVELLGSPFASGGALASSLWWVEAEWQAP